MLLTYSCLIFRQTFFEILIDLGVTKLMLCKQQYYVDRHRVLSVFSSAFNLLI